VSGIRYVCLSDTHFGANASLLSRVDYGAVGTYATPAAGRRPIVPGDGAASPVLDGLVACLADLVGDAAPGDRPTLILNGDILELALAEDNVAAMEFAKFLDLAFVQRELFRDIVFVPGNHDHHLWETARERQYAGYVAATPATTPLEPAWHATLMRDDVAVDGRRYRPVEAELVSAVLQRLGVAVSADVHYPTYGLFRPDAGTDAAPGAAGGAGRAVVFHHGHFAESIYLLMSSLQRTMFPAQPAAEEIWQWEADNYAWIDFVWSMLGRSGVVGTDVGLVYDLLKDPPSRAAVAAAMTDALAALLPHRTVVARVLELGARSAVKAVVDVALDAVAAMERLRGPDDTVPSASLAAGVTTLLDGPVAAQIGAENAGRIPERTTFVFGHTHKPYIAAMDTLARYPGGVEVYNSGGWVVDERRPDTRQGGSVILLDDDLNTVTVDLYRQQRVPGPAPIVVRTVAPSGNPLSEALAAAKSLQGGPANRDAG
jgi:hypothetical protein